MAQGCSWPARWHAKWHGTKRGKEKTLNQPVLILGLAEVQALYTHTGGRWIGRKTMYGRLQI